MDPGTALSVVSLVLQVSNGLYKYYQAWTDCEKDVKDLRIQLLGLSMAADCIRAALVRPGSRAEGHALTISALNKCNDAANELEQVLQKVSKTEADPKTALEKLKAKGLREGRKALYPFRRSTIQNSVEHVEDCHDACQEALQILHLNIGISAKEELGALDDRISSGLLDFTTALHDLHNSSVAIGDGITQHITARSDRNLVATQEARQVLEQRHDRTETLLLTAQDEKKAMAIVESLKYTEMESRRQTIEPAHTATLEWVFDKYDKRNCKLAQFLEAGSGIYWITGKPGSGKSTFTKFLAEHEQTETLLESWSGGKSCAVISHYLWVAGTKLQNSYEGLWRSLLYQLLILRPELVQKVCPRKWRSGSREWPVKDLFTCLQATLTSWPTHVCLFIDGLDEFKPESEHTALIEALETLQGQRHVKIVISSRPWPVFNRSLKSYTTSTMELFNRADILAYIRAVIVQSASDDVSDSIHWRCIDQGDRCGKVPTDFSCGTDEDSRNANNFAWALVKKADGVFLWIQMVMDRIRERLVSQRPVSELLQIVDDFPGDLETFFRKMVFDRIHDTWRGDETLMAVALVLRLNDQNFNCYATDLCMLSQGDSKADNSIRNPNFAYNTPCKMTSKEEYTAKLDNAASFLDGCCRDITKPLKVARDRLSSIPGAKIDFMHRTMYDFWRTPEMLDILQTRVPDHFWLGEFPPSVIVARARSARREDIYYRLNDLYSATQGRLGWTNSPSSPYVLINLFEETAEHLFLCMDSADDVDQDFDLQECIPYLCYLFAEEELFAVTNRILRARPYWLCRTQSRTLKIEPLALALSSEQTSHAFVGGLLAHGANPNSPGCNKKPWDTEKYMVTTMWAIYIAYLESEARSANKQSQTGGTMIGEELLSCAHTTDQDHEYCLPQNDLEIIREMIINGADLDAVVFLLHSGHRRPRGAVYYVEHIMIRKSSFRAKTTARHVLEGLLPIEQDPSWLKLLEEYSNPAKQKDIAAARLDIIRDWPDTYLRSGEKVSLSLPLWKPKDGYRGTAGLLFSEQTGSLKRCWDPDRHVPVPLWLFEPRDEPTRRNSTGRFTTDNPDVDSGLE